MGMLSVELQWGTVGEWASGVATFAAVVLTLWLVRHGRRQELMAAARQLEICEPWQRRTDTWAAGEEPPPLDPDGSVDWQLPVVNRAPLPIEWLQVTINLHGITDDRTMMVESLPCVDPARRMDLMFESLPTTVKPRIEDVRARFRLESEWFERSGTGAICRLPFWKALHWGKRVPDFRTVPEMLRP